MERSLLFGFAAKYIPIEPVRQPDKRRELLCCHRAPAGCAILTFDARFRAVFHTFAPHPTRLVDMAEHDWFTYAAEPGRTVRVSGSIRYDHCSQVFHEDAIRRWQDTTGQTVVRFAPLARRMFFPQEFELLLHYNGFTVTRRYGSWDGSPITNASQLMIMVCTRAA